MKTKVLLRPEGRPRTGVMQFDDDWPGVFIRGDDAMIYSITLGRALERLADDAWLEAASLVDLVDLLGSCRVTDS
jgi:hypothetical protein